MKKLAGCTITCRNHCFISTDHLNWWIPHPVCLSRFGSRKLRNVSHPEKIPRIIIILEPASRGILGDEADQNVLSFAQNSKIELDLSGLGSDQEEIRAFSVAPRKFRFRSWPAQPRKDRKLSKKRRVNHAKRSGQAFSENVCWSGISPNGMRLRRDHGKEISK